jgi:hypothetical protein
MDCMGEKFRRKWTLWQLKTPPAALQLDNDQLGCSAQLLEIRVISNKQAMAAAGSLVLGHGASLVYVEQYQDLPDIISAQVSL